MCVYVCWSCVRVRVCVPDSCGCKEEAVAGLKYPERSEGATKGLRVSTCVDPIGLSAQSIAYASASVFNKTTYESEVLFNEITDWLRVRQGRY